MMKTVQESNKHNVPAVIIDSNLNRLDDVVFFPKKVEKAKQTIETVGLPKKHIQQHDKGSKKY